MMKLGIIGLPSSGKTTIFNALTHGDFPTTISGKRYEIHTAVIDVPDKRVDQLVEIYHPLKTAYAKVTYADVAGLNGNASGNISGELLNTLSQMDGFIHIVRCFENPTVPHSKGSIDPQRDIDMMESEFLLNDLITVEDKIERLGKEKTKKNGRDEAEIKREGNLFKIMHANLSNGVPLRQMEFSLEEQKILSGYGFLSQKKMLIVLNLADGQSPPPLRAPSENVPLVPLQGKLEMEISQIPPEEARMFLDEYGIEEPSLEKIIRLSYNLLGLQSFFTVGEDEVHAWTIHQGASALEAAGTIHSDLMRGFIRAEVISSEDLIALGGFAEARSKGKLRLEGRDYVVHNGEIVHVRFNV